MLEYRGVKLVWLGHAGFRIQNGEVIYIDPFQIEGGAPKADIVLVSHEDEDHCSVDDLKKIVGANTVIVAHAQSKAELAKVAAKEIRIIKPGEKADIGNVTVEGVPAYNLYRFMEPGKVWHPKEDGKLGFVVTVKGVRIYHAGDTDHIPEMKNIRADIALLPVCGTYVMSPEEAAEAAAAINPKIAIPMHYDTLVTIKVGDKKDAEKFQTLAKCDVKILTKEP
jgi:L-ascorbate metabolism protein UlaG (beta-lactamase superfamily)